MSTFIIRDGHASIIPKGSAIYRGQTDAFEIVDGTAFLARNVISGDAPTFFGLEEQSITENYGLTAALLVTDDIRLLNIDDTEAYFELRALMKSLDPVAYQALIDSYPFNQEGGYVMRDSDKSNDLKVVEFICRHTSYEGYIQPIMPKVDGGKMHSEIAVCQPSTVKIQQSTGQGARNTRNHQGIMDEYQLRLQAEALKANRKRSHQPRYRADPPDPPSDEDERPLKRRLMFWST